MRQRQRSVKLVFHHLPSSLLRPSHLPLTPLLITIIIIIIIINHHQSSTDPHSLHKSNELNVYQDAASGRRQGNPESESESIPK